jgi:hypothetical protein
MVKALNKAGNLTLTDGNGRDNKYFIIEGIIFI